MTIELKGIDISEILNQYNGQENSNSETSVIEKKEDIEGPEIETNVTSLLHESSRRYKLWLDPSRFPIKMWINMVDYVEGGPLPVKTDKPCWWCRDIFESCPLGAPLKYHENVRNENLKDIIRLNLSKLNISSETAKDFFETEGIFCSFPCVKAWIIDRIKVDILYHNSGSLLTHLYYRLYGEIIDISPAPTWKIIDRWGGHLTVEEFRKTYCKLRYTITPNIKRPFMFSIGTYIEETRIL